MNPHAVFFLEFQERNDKALNYTNSVRMKLRQSCLSVGLSRLFLFQASVLFVLPIIGFAQSAPTISAIQNQRTFPNLPTRPIFFTVGDAQTPADQLVVTASSANTSSVPTTNIVFSGAGSNRTVVVIPDGVKGTNSITIFVQNTNGIVTNETFQITIADFTDIGANLTQVDSASVAWGDCDNDGFLDILITGSQTAKIYHNNGDETFTNIGANLQGVLAGGAVWGDYNNDGLLDILLTGIYNYSYWTEQGNMAQRVYRNNSSNNFTQVAVFENPNGGGGLQSLRTFSLAWGDYDNDGKLDAIIMGWPFSVFTHNNGGDSFGGGSIGLPGIFNTSVAWADYNNDGNLDFILAEGYPTTLYQNNGGGIFSNPTNAFPALSQGAVAWEDYNNDGNFDLAMAGSTNCIYAGDGHGTFTNLLVNLPGMNLASIAWGDFDNDGLPDLVLTSYSATQIFHNNGDGSFTDMGILLPGAGNGGVAVGDFNNDGCLDFAIAGGGVTKIFRNDGAMPNASPNPPANLNVTTTANSIVFNWSAATDSNQSSGFNYNLRVGTTSGGIDVVGPMANPATGFRRIPAVGNAGLRPSRTVTSLKPGTYHWSVQAIDHAFAGSVFAPEQSFTLVAPTITSQPTGQTNVLPVASFTVSADGTTPLSYQWFLNGTKLTDNGRISGSTTTNLSVLNVQASDLGNYTVVATNLVGSATSVVATITILTPIVTNQPQNRITWTGSSSSFSMNASGQAPLSYQWRFNGTNITDETNSALVFTSVQPSQFGVYDVVVSNLYGSVTSSIASLVFSQVAVWGSNTRGETSLTNGLTDIIGISGGPSGLFDCQALKTNGLVVSWQGSNNRGVSNLVAIAGAGIGVGLKSDGTVVRWTFNNPTTVSGLTNIVAIAPYNYGYLALMANGTVVGTAGTTGLSNIVAIAEGSAHSLALKANGTVVAWGNNTYGQTSVPLGLSNVSAIAAGYFHSLALKGDGTVVAWGRNIEKQTNVPPGLSNVVAIAGGGSHSLTLKDNGTVVAWGLNTSGQTNVPAGLTNIIAIAAGQNHSMALIGSGPPMLQSSLTNPTTASNRFTVSLPTQSGRVYALEYKNSLAESNWTALPLAAGNGSTLILADPTATNSQRFYHVKQW